MIRARCRRLVPLMVVALLALSCSDSGGGEADGVTPTPTPAPSGPLPEVADVAPDLEFFGDLAAVHSHPVSETFDSGAGSLSLADGAAIDVPVGAFTAPTELTVIIIDLLFEKYLVDPPEARVYVLSTEEDIALGAPVVLEVSKPSDSVIVTQFVGGEWLSVEVPAGPTTRVEIAHFSERVLLVGDRPSPSPELRPDVEATSGDVGANPLTACILMFARYFGDSGDDDVAFTSQIGYRVCTRALVNVLTPGGERVELACVGDKIGDSTNLEQAIAACLAEGAASEPITSAEPSDDERPLGGGFVVVVPPGSETCTPGEVTDAEPTTLAFGGDGTLRFSGSVTCLSEGTVYVATVTGDGTWDAEAGTYDVIVSIGSEVLGFTTAKLAGTIDFDNRTIEFNGDVLPITTTGD